MGLAGTQTGESCVVLPIIESPTPIDTIKV